MIEAKIVADSVNEFGNRLTTMMVTFPRFILAELNTHRMFSRNSASSRAIPFKKMVEMVKTNPFIPIAWQKEHTGMQGTEYLIDRTKIDLADAIWLDGKESAVSAAVRLSQSSALGVTKQLCNRLLEPFMNHTVLITASEWENFFALRCPQYQFTENGKLYRSWKDVCKENTMVRANATDLMKLGFNKGQAEIHMMALAEAMWDARNESVPAQLKAGEWHIPFGDKLAKDQVLQKMGYRSNVSNIATEDEMYQYYALRIATAMCARVSYTVVGEESKEPNYENDIKLHDRLLLSKHLSPFEHCGKAQSIPQQSGNFFGFDQYRKLIPGESGVQKE